MRGLRVLTVTGFMALTFCHPTDRPPLPPPTPTNPSTLAFLPAEVIDASIVLEGGTGWDGAPPYTLDAGAPGPTR
jgi:hypothetical protein